MIQEATSSPRHTAGTYVFLARRATTFAVRRQRIPTTNTTTQGTFAIRRQPFQLATSSPPAGEEMSALLFFSSNQTTRRKGSKGKQRFRFAKNKERTPALLIWRRRPLATSMDNRLAVPSRPGDSARRTAAAGTAGLLISLYGLLLDRKEIKIKVKGFS